jgi:integrase
VRKVPAVQRGQVYKLRGGSWAYRFRDEHGRRRQVSGFRTKGEASAKLAEALERVRIGPKRRELTVSDLVERYIAQHQAERSTIAKMRWLLKKAEEAFGDVDLRDLLVDEIGAWRMTIPEGHRWEATQAFRQVLNAGVRWKALEENPAKLVPNPAPKRAEILPFSSWEQLEPLAVELGPRWGAIAIFAAGTGLRPEEWIALERRDVDRRGKVVYVRRSFTDGRLRECGKTDRSRRRVPLRDRVLDALEAAPPRIDSPLLFPAKKGGFINLHNWRAREWKPAMRAAGIQPERRIYDLRHTYVFAGGRRGLVLARAPHGYIAGDD